MFLKLEKVLLLSCVLLTGNCITFAQKKGNLLTLGTECDFPISKKLDFKFGYGLNTSFIMPGKKTGAAIISFSYLKHQFEYFRYPSGGVPIFYKDYRDVYKISAGAMLKLGGNWYNIAQAGIIIRQYKNTGGNANLLLSVGPSVFLPVGKNKIRLGLNAAYSGGLFANLTAAYGFSL